MIPLSVCLFLAILAYFNPNKIGWFFLGAAPFFSALGHLVLVYHPVVPLRFHQALFAIAVGVACSPQHRQRLFYAFSKSRGLMLLTLFMVAEVAYGLLDPHQTLFKWFLLYQYPLYLAAIILTVSLIRSEEDLLFFSKILIATTFLITLLAYVEIVFGYNISHHLCAINYTSCKGIGLHWAPEELVKHGIYTPRAIVSCCSRYSGFTGDPNRTAILMAMFFPFLLYPFYSQNAKLIKRFDYYHLIFIGLVVVFICLLMSQVRAAIFATILAIMVIASIYFRFRPWVLAGIVLSMLPYVIFGQKFRNYVGGSISSRLDIADIITPDQRVRALNKSINLIVDTHGFGVGGDLYSVWGEHLDWDDLTAFIQYFVVGGFPLGFIYFALYVVILYDLYACVRLTSVERHKTILRMAFFSVVIGFITQLFNENAVLFYVLLIYSAAMASNLNPNETKQS